MEDIGMFEAIYSQRQISRFKPDPVPREAIEKILEAATKAPSGANSQPWEFVVITDRDLIQRVGQIYQEVWSSRHPPSHASWDKWFAERGPVPPAWPSSVYQSSRYLALHMHEAPVLILVCVDHSRGNFPHTPGQPIVRDRYASSIWPAVQNLFLAARALGLGTRLTREHLQREQEIKELLGIPDHVEPVVLTPLGYPNGRFGPNDRRPATDVTSYNRWGDRG